MKALGVPKNSLKKSTASKNLRKKIPIQGLKKLFWQFLKTTSKSLGWSLKNYSKIHVWKSLKILKFLVWKTQEVSDKSWKNAFEGLAWSIRILSKNSKKTPALKVPLKILKNKSLLQEKKPTKFLSQKFANLFRAFLCYLWKQSCVLSIFSSSTFDAATTANKAAWLRY